MLYYERKISEKKAVIKMFKTLVFHEIRPKEEIDLGMRPVIVKNGYVDQLPLPLFNSVSSFEKEMTYLVESGYHFLTLAEVKAFFYEKKSLPEKSVLITFDDCFQSMKTYAYPIIKKLEIPVTVFVATGWIFEETSEYSGEVSKALSFKELDEMSDYFTYANHTHDYHERRGIEASKLMWEDKENVVQDLEKCNEWVKEKDVFAYPFGLYDAENVSLLKDNGFTLAFTTKQGVTTRETNPLEIERTVIPFTMTLDEFKELMTY